MRYFIIVALMVILPGFLIISCEKSPDSDEIVYQTSTSPDNPENETKEPEHLRYLAVNAGNALPQFNCWEYKLCRESDVKSLRDYIAYWKPDVIMLSEICSEKQLTGTEMHGPVLPEGYVGICGESRDRATDEKTSYNAEGASHEHECVAWNVKRLSYIEGSALSAPGRNDDYGKKNCNYDFTAFRAELSFLMLSGESQTITAVAVHPDSGKAECRTEEISRYWKLLATGEKTIIGGDWNTDKDEEIQKPESFIVNYQRGQHWNIVNHSDEYSAEYLLGIKKKLDHAFSNFGTPCTTCGKFYGTPNLKYGSVLGNNDGHPRADGGQGMDHRQILVDILF